MARGKGNTAEDRSGSLFEPDTLVPSQFFGEGGAPAYQPERRLMLAVMEEAIATFQRSVIAGGRRSQKLADEVEQWMDARDFSWPFSFENICQALELESDSVREGLRRWKHRELSLASSQRKRVYRFPFRRVNGRRHSITGPREYYRKSA